MSLGLTALWQTALGTRVPHASWLVADGDDVLTAHEPDRMFSSGSMIKTFLLADALEEAADLAAPVVVGEALEGDGVLRLFALPVTLPLRELLALMIAVSDNTATHAVIGALGGEETINARLAARGFASRVRPAPGTLGRTSAAEHHRVVRALPPAGIDLLAEQQDRRALGRHLPHGTRFAHKTGTIDRVRHDGGVLGTLHVHAFTDGGPLPEWTDHPACLGMGLAMAWTCMELGVDVELAPGTPEPPR